MRKDSMGNYDMMEMMRLDEPETYEKRVKFMDRTFELFSRRGESAEIDAREGLWRFNTKFNVLISQDMFMGLSGLSNYHDRSAEEKIDVYDIVGKLVGSVEELKDVEKEYEGNLEYLRFGVKLYDDGQVTYHANYKGCENPDGIETNSADELLEMLLSK